MLCAPVESYATATSGPTFDVSVLDKTMNDFRNITYSWQDTFQNAAKTLFWLLVPVAMVWRFRQIAMQNGGATEALAEFVKFTIFVGFYWWLVKYGCTIVEAILNSMETLGGKIDGSSKNALDPSYVMNIGISTFETACNAIMQSGTGLKNIPTCLVLLIIAFITLAICAVVAINLLIAIVTVYILMYVGVFILGFGATSWTSDIAIGYFRSVFSASLRVLGMMLIVGVCDQVIQNVSNSIDWSKVLDFSCSTELLITALMMYLLTEKVPDQLASLANGQLGSNHAAVSNAGMFATAQMAAGLAISTATGGVGAAAGTAAKTALGDAASQKLSLEASNAAADAAIEQFRSSRMDQGGTMGSISGGGSGGGSGGRSGSDWANKEAQMLQKMLNSTE